MFCILFNFQTRSRNESEKKLNEEIAVTLNLLIETLK